MSLGTPHNVLAFIKAMDNKYQQMAKKGAPVYETISSNNFRLIDSNFTASIVNPQVESKVWMMFRKLLDFSSL